MNFIVDVFPNTDVLQYQNNIIFAHECLLSGSSFSGELRETWTSGFWFFFIYQHFAFPPLYIITFSVHVVGQMMIFTYATKYKSTEVGKNEFLK